MKFRPLPPGLAQRMIAGETDTLTPLMDQRISTIKATPCPRCHASMAPHMDPTHMYRDSDPLPRVVAKCQECGAELDPATGIVVDRGDSRRVEDPLPIFKKH